MTHALRLGKRVFTISVVVTTIAWSIGLAAFLMPLTANAAVNAGDLIKASLPAVYYFGSDGKRYVFPNEKTYFTWYSDFSTVKTITDSELAAIPIGGNATYKPGVKMVKITTDPKVYAVDAHGVLRWITSEAIAASLYGSAWNTWIHDVPDPFFVNYTVGADINSASDYNKEAAMNNSTSINVDKGLGEAPVSTYGALTVSLASDTPISNSVLTDTGGSASTPNLAQALAPFTTFVFTASSAGPVTVNTLKLRRTGISADTDFSDVYIYDGSTRVGESGSFDSGYVTVNNASGLFTVPAGGSKKITVKADLANTDTSIAGKTFRFSLESASHVTSNAGSVGGSFPVVGNYMTGASVTDLASFTVATYTSFPATIDPGVENRELWRFNVVGGNWDVNVEYLKLTVVGTIAAGDLANLKLVVNGVQLGSTVQLNSEKEAIFDLTAAPYVITSGATRTIQVMGDVVSGTNRAFKFSFQKAADLVAKDSNYGVYLKPAKDSSTTGFSLIQPETGDGTNINTGTLTITRADDSPTGYITKGLTNAVLAKYQIKANGEDVKITEFGVSTTQSVDGTSDLNNGKIYINGVQVGNTTDLDSAASDDGSQATWADDGGANDDDTRFTFGNSLVIPSGQTKTLEIRADIKSGTSSDLSNNNVINVYLNKGAQGASSEGTAAAANGSGQVSLASITSAASAGLPLTVSGGTVTVLENQGFADKSSSIPTGVEGGTNVKIGSFVITAGSGEGVDVSQIVLSDYAHPAANNFQNLKLLHEGAQIGTAIGTLNSSSSTYTFAPSPAISVLAGQQYIVDIYADVLTDATNDSETMIPFSLAANAITATGQISGLSATGPTTAVVLQNTYLATGGNLAILVAADTPVAGQLVMGETDVTLAKFRLQAGSAEGATVTQLSVSDVMSAYYVDAATGTLRNLKLYDGSTLIGTVAALTDNNSAVSSSAYATFTALNIEVPKDGSKTITVKADVVPYSSLSVTSSRHRVSILRDYKENGHGAASSTNNTVIAWGSSSGAQLEGNSLDYNADSTIGNTDIDCLGKAFDVFKSKISVALHSTSPSGVSTGSTEQTVAKFVVSNESPGGYTARVRNMNFSISSSGFSMISSTSITVYKSSVYTSDNRLATCTYCGGTACRDANYSDTVIAEADFTDLDVSAGSSRIVYVTLNTTSAGDDTTAETLTVGMSTGDLEWDEDAYDAENGTTGSNRGGSGVSLTESPSLPVTGNTLSY